MAPRSIVQEVLLAALRQRGVATALELADACRASQPTVSRALATCASELHRFGRARATRYALQRAVGTLGTTWPLYRIDRAGRARSVGKLHALYGGYWYFEAGPPTTEWAWAAHRGGLFFGLPWFLDDLRAQGFLGRAFAQAKAAAEGANPDPTAWSDDQILMGLCLYGDDLPGDFVLGDLALQNAQRKVAAAPTIIASADRPARYSELSAAALQGDFLGASIGGEQPKFSATVEDGNGVVRQVIVKFSEAVQTPSKRRWFDLLLCEQYAATILREHSIVAVETELVIAGERLCLEITRFDRVGAHGRRGVLSLAALTAGQYGKLDSWLDAADRLQRDAWLTKDHADTLRTLYWFAGLIGNNDASFGNISLFLDVTRPLALASIYDMLPMLYRPAGNGEIVARNFEPALPPPNAAAHWLRAAEIALTFWKHVAADVRVSLAFREIARENARRVEALRQRFA